MTNTQTLPPIDEARFAEHRVFAIECAGGRVWAKYGGKNYANGLLKFLGLFRRESTIALETRAIEALRGDGFLVPEILGGNERYIVLSDIGPVLHVTLREADAIERERLVQEAAKALRALHEAGHWHGAAALKNMTVKDGRIGFIDFESAMHRYIGVRATQWLDVWQLACSVAYFDTQGALVTLFLQAYGDVRPLTRITYLLWPLYLVLRPFGDALPRDVRQPVRALRGFYNV